MRAVTVERVGMDVDGDDAVVLLRDSESKKVLPIWIGMVEATAIALKLQEQEPPRPLTLDLLKAVLDSFDAKVLMVVVNDMKDRTYFARIFVRANSRGSTTLELDARPSDSIGLALRTGAPIYVADWIFDEAGVDAVIEDAGSGEDEEPPH